MALSIFSLMGSIFVDSTEAEKSIEKTEEKSSKLSESFMSGISTVGKWAAGLAAAAGTAAVALGTAAVNVSNDVDKAMNSFAASTGVASEELAKYEESMLNIYNNNFGESFEDIANAMSSIKQVMGDGMGAEELEAMTQNALMLRDTFEFDVTESVRAVNSMMDQFGISSEEAYNLIAQGAQNGLNQNGDLMDIINEYSVKFSQMGYGAEDMFNMLANGAESGTWSVDKLGDALKEFNIRTRDGSEASAEAFRAIGLAIGDTSGDLKKAQSDAASYEKSIADLEKKLKYAKMEQAAFNDKTSALKKEKTADNIAEWSAQLEQLKGKLNGANSSIASLSAQTTQSGMTADELFQKFAAGGEDAQAATQEVIAALKSMDDKVAQDAAGVALFGTMWEDLGADALFAMMETEGAITGTKDALEEINQVKYDDLGSMIEGLKRNFETMLLPLGNALIPIITQVIGLIQDNMPMIEEMIATLTPIITDLFDMALPPLMELIQSLLPPLMDLISSLIPPISEILEAILPVLINLINILLPPLMNLIDLILPILISLFDLILPLLQPILDILTPILDAIMAVITPILQLIDAILPPLINVITFLVEVVLFNLKNAFTTVADVVKNVVNVAVGYVKNQIDLLKSIFGNIIDFFKNVFTGNWKGAWDNVKNIIKDTFQMMINYVKQPVNTIIGIINGLISGVTKGINSVIKVLNGLQIDVPDWVKELTGIDNFGFHLTEVTAPQIPLLAEGGNIAESGHVIAGEAGAELIDLPQGARVTPLTSNGDPIGYKAMATKMDTMITLLSAILEKDTNVHIGEKEFVSYVDKSLGALL